MIKVLLYILCILFIYRTLSRLIFGSRSSQKGQKKTSGGKNITYQDADFEEID